MGKRIFDIFFSLVSIVLLSWIIIACWIIAAIDTKSSGIFIQKRIGQYGMPFNIYKLRTIQKSIISSPAAISKIGEFLRRNKLDELPQLLNVLLGDMSIVGPRPDLPGYYDLLTGENRKVLELKPGLTSVSALKYHNEDIFLRQKVSPVHYNDKVLFPDKVRLNLNYYYNRTFFGDLQIILRTLSLVFFKKGIFKS